jgi:ABC-2 type transport system ATP-binding protein
LSLPAQLENVTKRFGPVEALAGLSLEIDTGELVALLGPNGAGKTTVLSLLLGLRRPDAGSAHLFGRDPREPAARSTVGMTPQESALPQLLTVREVIELVRAHFRAPFDTADVLDRFALSALEARKAGGLSGGEKRKLAVALAFVGRPRLVVLDEPTTGLDVEGRHGLWRVVGEYVAGGATVLFSTHYLDEAEAHASRVVVLNRGRGVADGSVAAITAQVGLTRVAFSLDGELPALPGVVRSDRSAGRWTLDCRDSDQVVRALVDRRVAFSRLEVRSAPLEEAFRALTEPHS